MAGCSRSKAPLGRGSLCMNEELFFKCSESVENDHSWPLGVVPGESACDDSPSPGSRLARVRCFAIIIRVSYMVVCS